MKAKPTLFLLALPLTASLATAQSSAVTPPPAQVASSGKLTPGSILAAQIREIAGTKDLNAASKKRQIASAAQLAATTAVTNVRDADQAYQLLLELATEAAQAAPDFTNVILDAVVGAAAKLPVFASRPELLGRLRDKVVAALETPADDEAAGAAASASARPPANPEFGGKTDAVIVSPST